MSIHVPDRYTCLHPALHAKRKRKIVFGVIVRLWTVEARQRCRLQTLYFVLFRNKQDLDDFAEPRMVVASRSIRRDGLTTWKYFRTNRRTIAPSNCRRAKSVSKRPSTGVLNVSRRAFETAANNQTKKKATFRVLWRDSRSGTWNPNSFTSRTTT